MGTLHPPSREISVADWEARLEVLEARVVELEERRAAGVATAAEVAELLRVQAEADFYVEALNDLGAFNPVQAPGAVSYS